MYTAGSNSGIDAIGNGLVGGRRATQSKRGKGRGEWRKENTRLGMQIPVPDP
jgi:hypothetical protein